MKKTLPKYTTDLKGVVYFRRHGKAQRMIAAPFTDAFWAEYALMLKGIAPAPKGKTLADLIASYKRSPKFTKLAERTRKDYDGVLAFLVKRMGHVRPDRIGRKEVIRLRDTNAGTVRFANYAVQVLRIIMEHGIDQGVIASGANPAKGVGLLKSESEPRGPWPQPMVDAFRAAVPLGHRTRTLFELLIGTGQRIGDVLKMQWNHIDGDGINVRQNKTGAKLWVPFTPHLRAALEAHKRDNLTILTKQHGNGPWAYRGAADALMAVRIEIGAEAYDAHSLRYSAACELLMNGCSDDLIAAVTGQSGRMVAHYTKSVRQKVRAIKAQGTRK